MKTFLSFCRENEHVLSRMRVVCAYAVAAAAVFWICTFKIMDRDFWWHITAGKVMLEQGRLILTDPFAYTRAGLPYLATHEWLAQIPLHLIYSWAGSTGIILFRGVIACTCMALLLQLSQRFRYLYLALAVWAVVITKGSFLERPQLFTFVIFAACILLAFRFLDALTLRRRLAIAAGFVALQILWVNMHGGAALLGCAVLAFLLIQSLVPLLTRYRRKEDAQTAIVLFCTMLLLFGVLVLPPNGFGNITYLRELLTDKTIAFIAEWQPRAWGLYLRELWPFFLLSFTALVTGRRHWIFNGLLLCATAYLSRDAFRHEILFVFAAIATCFYQFDHGDWLDMQLNRLKRYPRTLAIMTFILVLVLVQIAASRSFGFERQDNLFGFGQFDLAKGAVDFVEREGIKGNMFNTYGIGGYLIYRGHPDRKVFIDGRNVDYGFDFMARTYAAGLSADRWEELAYMYDVNYAIVDYDAIKLQDKLPYSAVLDVDPQWSMVYIDDWTAVYVKKTAENASLIDRLAYRHVTTTDLQFRNEFPGQTSANNPELVRELRRIQHDEPKGIKATMALAKIALRDGNFDDVVSLAETARKVRPFDPEPLAVLSGMYVSKQQWGDACSTLTEMLQLAGDNYPDIDYGFIANVCEKAGHSWQAWFLRMNVDSPKPPVDAVKSGSGTAHANDSGLAVNPAADAQMYNEQGVTQAEEGRFVEAQQSFEVSLKINPSSAEAWNNLCGVHIAQERYVQAVEACQRAVQINQVFADARFNLALAYYHNGSFKESEAEALQAKSLGREKESDQLLLLIRKELP